MKQLLVAVACAVCFAGLTGCQRPVQTTASVGGVEVVVEGDGKFPEFLAGRWIADKGSWEIVFEPDGTISSVVLGGMPRGEEVVPGKSQSDSRDGLTTVYEPGLWSVQYSPESRELTVEIVMDLVHLEKEPVAIIGEVRDVFVGQVSEDGSMWETEWFTYPDYTIFNPEPKEFRLDPRKSRLGIVTFEKHEDGMLLQGLSQ